MIQTPQIAYDVMEAEPLPFTRTMAVADQPLPDGAELAIAALTSLPCVMKAPPPSSLLSLGHVTVEVPAVLPIAGCLPC